MKRARLSLITIALVPFLLIYSLAPRVNLRLLGDLLSRQPVEVYSFIWIPLLEVSMLITQKVLPPETITPTAAPEASNQGKTPNPAGTENCLFFIVPTGILIAAIRKLLLSLVAFLRDFLFEDVLDEPARAYLSFPLPSLCFLPVLRSNPALPRGDPPLFMPEAVR